MSEQIYNLAVVAKVTGISPHPNADRLDLLQIWMPLRNGSFTTTLVVGKHYRLGDLGVWLKPGAVVGRELARSMWMPAGMPFEVRDMDIRGQNSPGLWCGAWYRNELGQPSKFNSATRNRGADRAEDGWLHWKFFRDDWQPGDIVDEALGLTSLRSSTAEQPTASRQDVDGGGRATTSVKGSNPAAGSILSAGGASA